MLNREERRKAKKKRSKDTPKFNRDTIVGKHKRFKGYDKSSRFSSKPYFNEIY